LLLQQYIDSYYIVLFAINDLMEKGIVIEQQKLVDELHLGIQEIYNRGGIKFIDSCLFEVVNTAFGRFSELGVCHSQAYDAQSGSKTVYLQCPLSNRAKIEWYLEILTHLSIGEKNKDKVINVIEQELNKVIAHAQGPMARL